MKIVAIVGSYHRGGVVHTAVDQMLASAQAHGAIVEKIDLLDQRIEFCTNCQACLQCPGVSRGLCPHEDDMNRILDRVAEADAVVLASPMNFWTVTALMKRFIERLVCLGYWPWTATAPENRPQPRAKRAVIVASSAAPAILARPFTGMAGLLRASVRLMGAKRVKTFFIGMARNKPGWTIRPGVLRRADRLGKFLATSRGANST